MTTLRSALRSGAPLLALGLVACSGGSAPGTQTLAPPTPAVAVAIAPPSASLAARGQQSFGALVTGASDTSVTWSVQEGATGGSVGTDGLYTAPATAGVYHVVATSNADTARSASAAVTVSAPASAVTVSVTPNPGAASACRTATFTAAVSGTTNAAVSWSVSEGAAGGSITAAGVYSAPSTPGTYHVVARSEADTRATSTVPVTVSTKVLGIQLSPTQTSIDTGATAQFTATVTTTCGVGTQAVALPQRAAN